MTRNTSHRQTLAVIRHDLRNALPASAAVWLAAISLLAPVSGLAAPQELGRLFYTPEQRAQLETARTHPAMQRGSRSTGGATDSPPAPLRFDGVVIRSDGTTTRWVDGKPQVGASGVAGLKPGQVRANGKVYEPYQVLRPAVPGATQPDIKETTP
jgi:hypothetical protein